MVGANHFVASGNINIMKVQCLLAPITLHPADLTQYFTACKRPGGMLSL
jgi:hypothetical protein